MDTLYHPSRGTNYDHWVPKNPSTMTETRFNVGMTCEGCASAIKRILGKMEGVNSVETNVEAKTVVVQAEDAVSPQELLEKLQKWSQASGKSVALA